MNFQVIFIIFCSCSFGLNDVYHIKNCRTFKGCVSRNFLHLYFLAPPSAVKCCFPKIVYLVIFPSLRKPPLSTLRPVTLLGLCPVLSHGSINEKKFQVPNFIQSFAAVRLYVTLQGSLTDTFTI